MTTPPTPDSPPAPTARSASPLPPPATPDGMAPGAPPPSRGWRQLAGWAAGLALLLVLTGTLLNRWLPDWLRPRLEASASEALGTPVQLARIELNLWRLDLQLHGLQVGPAEAPLAQLEQAHVRLSAATFWRLAPVVEQLQLIGPNLWLRREAPERTNWSPLLTHLAAYQQAQRAGQPEPPPSTEPARFALHNIELRDGRIHLQDEVLQQRHEIEALQIGLPFISNLPSDVQVVVQPRLEAKLDGSTLGLAAQARPFAPGQPAQLELRWRDLALAPWLGLLKPVLPPAWLPQLDSATLDATLQLDFEQSAQTSRLVAKGDATLRDLDLQLPQQGLATRWRTLQLRGLEIAPLAHDYRIASVELDGLDARLIHRAAPASSAATSATTSATTAKAATPAASSAAPASAAAASAAPAAGPRWQIGSVRCRDCALRLQDASVQPAARIELRELQLALTDLSSDPARPVGATLSSQVVSGVGHQPDTPPGRLELHGQWQAAPQALQAEVQLDAIDLSVLQPYLTLRLDLTLLSGQLATQGRLTLRSPSGAAGAAGAPPALRYQGRLALAQLRTQQGSSRAELVRWQQLGLDGLDLGWQDGALTAELARLDLNGLDARLLLRPDGQLNLLDLPRRDPAAAAAGTPGQPAEHGVGRNSGTTAATPPPRWHITQADCQQCRISLQDTRVEPATRLQLQQLALTLHDLSSDTARSVRWSLGGQLVSALADQADSPPGTLKLQGRLRQAPLALQADVELGRIDLRVLQPYLAPQLNLVLTGGQLGSQGQLTLEQAPTRPLALRYQGRLALDQIRSQDGVTGDEFMRWQQLGFEALDLGWHDGALHADLGRIRLDGLDARVIVHPDGHLNLADVQRRTPESATSLTTPQAAASAPMATPTPTPAASAAASAPAAAPAASAAPPDLRWQDIKIERSELQFSDFYIRPNYSARLTRLQGSVSALSAASPEPAQVELAGALDDGAPLRIAGQVHPLGVQLYTDIEASARGIALPRLNSYSERYTGYGIEKGSLSATLKYHVEQGRLSADHQLYLDQLSFGDLVERPGLTPLPVRLAVALLQDRHGVIDLRLPVSGTLDDPKFSLGGLVWQALGNLISKAVTAPFALLMGSDGESSGQIDFAPGSAELSPAARERLDALAKRLADRPGVRLEATGSADPARDAEALLQARRAAARAAATPASDRSARSAAAAASAAAPAVSTDELQSLADRRATGVMAYLAEHLPAERILLNRSVLRQADGAASASSVQLGLR